MVARRSLRSPRTAPARHFRRRLAPALAAALLCGLAQAQEMRFAPIDDNSTNAQWLHYKKLLLQALEDRNRNAVLAAIDPNVDNGPEQKRGIAELRRRWDFQDDKSPFWDELRKSVELGGAYVKDEKGATRFCAPYVAAKWPTTVDPFKFGAITASDALVKSEPSSEARTLATLEHDVVRVEDWEVPDKLAGYPQKWTRIQVRSGPGYVPEQQIRSPIEHMACFRQQGGSWRLVSFTAGYLPE